MTDDTLAPDWRSPLPPGFAWPAGVRAAACLTFDVDAESPILFDHPESADWLDVMRKAHRLGYKSTATMMYGHLETDEDIVEHLEQVRVLQDETGGFTAFVPWSFKPGNTPLEKIIPHYATPIRYLQMIAFSRIYLDNVPHIQASWFSEGKKTGQIALHFGADDFGGTLLEENVHAAANFVNKTNTDECKLLIREAGFLPAQRSTLYEILAVEEQEAVV